MYQQGDKIWAQTSHWQSATLLSQQEHTFTVQLDSNEITQVNKILSRLDTTNEEFKRMMSGPFNLTQLTTEHMNINEISNVCCSVHCTALVPFGHYNFIC